MSQEQEIKLQVLTSTPLDLSASLLLTQYQVQAPSTHTLTNTYFDTADKQLLKHGFGLRLRGFDEDWLQTVKTTGHVIGGLHQRQEWEQNLKGPDLDRAQLAATGLETLIADDAFWAAISPVFTTHFSREKWLLEFEGTLIELAYDQGRVESGDKQSPIHEVELELVSGAIEHLKTFAEDFKTLWPLAYSDVSKAQMGYTLASE